MSKILEWVSMSLIPGLGDVGIRSLVSHYGSVGELLRASRKELENESGLKPAVIKRLIDHKTLFRAGESELHKLKRFGGKAMCLDDECYPALLKETGRPPVVLYTLGNRDILNQCCVAVVGSRAATDYGRQCAFNFGSELGARSVVVVSGMALGIDTQAHHGCLSVSGSTAAVLGCGLDVIYPYRNKQLYQQIRNQGVLVSEYPLGTRPDAFRFPARNRIIAGLSRGVVVVEAARKSGSLITASMALEEGREVFGVPGRIDSFKSAGTHWLLQQGAKLVQGADDILEEFRMVCAEQRHQPSVSNEKKSASVGNEQNKLLEMLDVYPIHKDEMVHRSGLSAARVNELLLYLELEGLVEILVGGEIQKRVR